MSNRTSLLLIGLLAAVAAQPAAGASTGGPFSVGSTLDGKNVLPIRIHWIAKPDLPAAKIKEVDFLIDGHLAWVEHKAPYVYADDGNWLVTSFLKPGEHTFALEAIATDGRTARDSVSARVVGSPAPPSALAGTWQRTATAADVRRASSSQPPPPGLWKIKMSSLGWTMTDPNNGGGLFDVIYLSPSRVQLRPTIETPPFPNPANGGWCDDTDPLATWTAVVSGNTLTLAPAGHDPCGDRIAILDGSWTRVAG